MYLLCSINCEITIFKFLRLSFDSLCRLWRSKVVGGDRERGHRLTVVTAAWTVDFPLLWAAYYRLRCIQSVTLEWTFISVVCNSLPWASAITWRCGFPEAILLHHVEIRCVEQARCATQSPSAFEQTTEKNRHLLLRSCCSDLFFLRTLLKKAWASESCAEPLP